MKTASLRDMLRTILLHLPTRSRWSVARRLVSRANSERDARIYPVAGALYDEALKLAPDAPRFQMQFAHMLKEAGDHAGAEALYLKAAAALPGNPDVAIQLGHFYKVAGRPDEAEAAYRRAAELRPGWVEAQEELARVRSLPANAAQRDDILHGLVPEIAPVDAPSGAARMREGFFLRRLGASQARTRGVHRRVLRGIEAIHGFVISGSELAELSVLIDGVPVRNVPLLSTRRLDGGQTKYVFNVWHDFSVAVPGQKIVELRAVGARGSTLVHRQLIDIVAPMAEADYPASDAVVESCEPNGHGLEAEINGRPSMVRPAARSVLAEPPKAILVQRVDQLGDMVCSVPALQRLRALFPAAKLIALVTKANADFARTLDMIDDIVVIAFDEGGDGRRTMLLKDQEALRQKLAGYAFDIAIDLGETAGSRPLLLLSGAPFLYGFKDREFPWLNAGFELNTHDPANHHAAAATAHKLVAMIDSLGEITARAPTLLRREDLDPAILTTLGIDPTRRYAVLHTGARLAYTRWPGFAELARLLLARTSLDLVILGEDRLEGLEDQERLLNLNGRMDFDQFDALLHHCALFVGSDSGPKHLASLRGAPVVSVHMARLNWNEWGQEASGLIVSRRVPCAGCGIGIDGDECGQQWACLRHIRPEEVFEAASRLL